jgi:hypothetical protein
VGARGALRTSNRCGASLRSHAAAISAVPELLALVNSTRLSGWAIGESPRELSGPACSQGLARQVGRVAP